MSRRSRVYRTAHRALDELLPPFFEKPARTITHVGLFVGPYRNLSTLAAALLSLHTECVVLNHAFDRAFRAGTDRNFIASYSAERLHRFIRFAISAARLGGQRGDFGGSIRHAHAFEDATLRSLYDARARETKTPRALVWKESQRVTNHIRHHGTLETLLTRTDKITFILPIRDPIDCAHSNLKTGHARFLGDQVVDLESCLDAILREFAFWCEVKERHPERVFFIWQDNVTVQQLTELATTLSLTPSPQWIDGVKSVYRIKQKPSHEREELAYCRQLIETHLADHPAFREHLHTIIDR